jgi:hypothetical protein
LKAKIAKVLPTLSIKHKYKLSFVHAFTQTIVGEPIKPRNKPKNVQNIHKQQKEGKNGRKASVR